VNFYKEGRDGDEDKVSELWKANVLGG